MICSWVCVNSGVAVGWWKGVGFLLWVMWVHGGEGGGLRGDGGGRVVVRFLEES